MASMCRLALIGSIRGICEIKSLRRKMGPSREVALRVTRKPGIAPATEYNLYYSFRSAKGNNDGQ